MSLRNLTAFAPLILARTLIVYRHLLWQMVVRDLTSRFAGTSLGACWGLLQPLILLGLYAFVFSFVYRVRLEGHVGFIPFVFCGLWPWMAFQEACLRSVGVIIENAQLVKRIQFPSELLVIATILSSFLSQGIGFVLFLVGLAVWQGGVSSSSALFLLPVPVVLQLLLAVALGLLLATGNVFLRDVSQLASAGFTMWFFLTPVLYPLEMVPHQLQRLLAWNPMTEIVALYRALILTPGEVSWQWALYPLVLSLLLLGVAHGGFQRCKGYFADYL
ncbi:MAG: ABC transporter permease [Candidatus Binatia bacterium]|nr:ABC transporter permease [Candidatus Binatia bacterium]